MIKISSDNKKFSDIIEDFNKSLIEIYSFVIDEIPLNQDTPATQQKLL